MCFLTVPDSKARIPLRLSRTFTLSFGFSFSGRVGAKGPTWGRGRQHAGKQHSETNTKHGALVLALMAQRGPPGKGVASTQESSTVRPAHRECGTRSGLKMAPRGPTWRIPQNTPGNRQHTKTRKLSPAHNQHTEKRGLAITRTEMGGGKRSSYQEVRIPPRNR